MTIRDIINPWGALRHARAELTHQTANSVSLAQALVDAQDAADKAREEAQAQANVALARAFEIARLQRLLAAAHFRNPATGRLGKRGETFG